MTLDGARIVGDAPEMPPEDPATFARIEQRWRDLAQLERALVGTPLRFEPLPRGGLKIDYDDNKHEYRLNSEKVDSVTQILDKGEPKPALTWWGFRVGMAGVLRALAESKVSLGALTAWDWEYVIKPGIDAKHPDCDRPAKPRSKLEALVVGELRHSPNHIKEDKGTLGTSIHNAAESTGVTGRVPRIEEFPEADRGYLQAFARFWLDHDPEVLLQEVIVASWTHRFAGRFDLVARTAAHGRARFDYKTAGGIYASNDVQMSGYDLAQAEMYATTGDEQFAPVDGSYLVHLRPDGTYEVVPATIDHADFLGELVAVRQRADRDVRIRALGRKP
jgi:hypothetical protein